jgi:multicomponent Na+:H+ antiporter subunit E
MARADPGNAFEPGVSRLRRTDALSVPGDVARPIAVAIAARAAMFLGFWLMISGRELADLPVGMTAVAAATWTSLRLLPAGRSRPRPLALATFALRFIRQSAVSGVQVAWLAFNPRLRLRPGFVTYPLHLPPGGARSAFCALSSLLPGTLPAGTDDTGALVIHCLDVDQAVLANLAADETLFIGGLGDG